MFDRAQGALERSLSRQNQVVLVGEGALIGLVGGGVVTLYRLSLSHAEGLLRSVTGFIGAHPLLIPLWFVVLAVILFVVCRLMLWEPYTQGSGIPQTDAEAIGRIDMPWYRVMVAKFVEGTLCAFAGLSLGREGPSVQLGGMGGKAVAKLLHRDRDDESLFVTCGAAAGMAAAFHAPLTGILFAVEEIHKVFSASLVVTAMASAVASDFFVSQVIGVAPTLSFKLASDLPHEHYLAVIVMGLVCGLAGAAHNAGMFACQGLYSHIQRHIPYARLAVPFAMAGVVAFVAPDFMCGGDAILQQLLRPQALSLATICYLLLGKYLFTTVCFASGAPGGTLFPLVVMGSLLGALFGNVTIPLMGISSSYMTNFICLGIAGLFAGVVRAPVTAIVLVFELTGSLDALLSVSIVSMVAYVVANLTDVDPFYEHLLSALLSSLPDQPRGGAARGVTLKTFMVELGSKADGACVADLPWPQDALVVLVERSGQRMTPHGRTRLEAADELVVMVSKASFASSVEAIHGLCASPVLDGSPD